jgi:hypothetical protein
MLKKLAVAVIGTACVVIPLAAATTADAATPNYHHVVAVTAHQHVYWDRNWPSPNRSTDMSYYQSGQFYSNSPWAAAESDFNTTTSFGGLSDLAGVEEAARVKSIEIPNSGGRIAVKFDNGLSYGGNCSGCWHNNTEANFSINVNGTAYYTLITSHGDGSWGETDVVITNYVY